MAARRSTPTRTPDVRRVRRGLAGLLVANVVSVAGGLLSVVALPWFVLATTGSPVAAGLAAACETVPLVAVAAVAGAVVDRFGALGTRVGSDVVSAGTVLAIPALHATTGIAFWQLLVLVAVNGAVRAPAPAASLVLLDDLSTSGGVAAGRSRSVYLASVRLAAAVGAPLGGAVIAAWGAPTALLLDATSFVGSALVLLAAVRGPRSAPDQRVRTSAPRARAPGAAAGAWAGLGVLTSDRLLALLCALLVAGAVVDGAWVSVLAPAYGQRVLGDPTALGVLFGTSAVGALLGNLVHPWVGARVDARTLVWSCLAVGTALRFGALSADPALSVLAAATILAGAGSGVLGPLWLGLLMDRTAPRLRGHVFGASFALQQGATALGAVSGGLVLDRLSLRTTLVAAAGAGALLAVVAAVHPATRDLRRSAEGALATRGAG